MEPSARPFWRRAPTQQQQHSEELPPCSDGPVFLSCRVRPAGPLFFFFRLGCVAWKRTPPTEMRAFSHLRANSSAPQCRVQCTGEEEGSATSSCAYTLSWRQNTQRWPPLSPPACPCARWSSALRRSPSAHHRATVIGANAEEAPSAPRKTVAARTGRVYRSRSRAHARRCASERISSPAGCMTSGVNYHDGGGWSGRGRRRSCRRRV